MKNEKTRTLRMGLCIAVLLFCASFLCGALLLLSGMTATAEETAINCTSGDFVWVTKSEQNVYFRYVGTESVSRGHQKSEVLENADNLTVSLYKEDGSKVDVTGVNLTYESDTTANTTFVIALPGNVEGTTKVTNYTKITFPKGKYGQFNFTEEFVAVRRKAADGSWAWSTVDYTMRDFIITDRSCSANSATFVLTYQGDHKLLVPNDSELPLSAMTVTVKKTDGTVDSVSASTFMVSGKVLKVTVNCTGMGTDCTVTFPQGHYNADSGAALRAIYLAENFVIRVKAANFAKFDYSIDCTSSDFVKTIDGPSGGLYFQYIGIGPVVQFPHDYFLEPENSVEATFELPGGKEVNQNVSLLYPVRGGVPAGAVEFRITMPKITDDGTEYTYNEFNKITLKAGLYGQFNFTEDFVITRYTVKGENKWETIPHVKVRAEDFTISTASADTTNNRYNLYLKHTDPITQDSWKAITAYEAIAGVKNDGSKGNITLQSFQTSTNDGADGRLLMIAINGADTLNDYTSITIPAGYYDYPESQKAGLYLEEDIVVYTPTGIKADGTVSTSCTLQAPIDFAWSNVKFLHHDAAGNRAVENYAVDGLEENFSAWDTGLWTIPAVLTVDGERSDTKITAQGAKNAQTIDFWLSGHQSDNAGKKVTLTLSPVVQYYSSANAVINYTGTVTLYRLSDGWWVQNTKTVINGTEYDIYENADLGALESSAQNGTFAGYTVGDKIYPADAVSLYGEINHTHINYNGKGAAAAYSPTPAYTNGAKLTGGTTDAQKQANSAVTFTVLRQSDADALSAKGVTVTGAGVLYIDKSALPSGTPLVKNTAGATDKTIAGTAYVNNALSQEIKLTDLFGTDKVAHKTGAYTVRAYITVTYNGGAEATLYGNAIEYKCTDCVSDGIAHTVASDCQTQGYEYHTCLLCGDQLKIDGSDLPLGAHTYGTEVHTHPSTCAPNGYGYTYNVCEKCGDEHKIADLTELAAHTPTGDWIVDVEPTADSEGHRYKLCEVCGEHALDETIGVHQHDHSGGLLTKDATCAAEGYTYYVCAACGQTEIVSTIPKIAHTEGDWITDKAATADEPGHMHKECSVCGEVTQEQTTPRLTEPEQPAPSGGCSSAMGAYSAAGASIALLCAAAAMRLKGKRKGYKVKP